VLVSAFLSKVNYALRGTDDDAPSFGSEEANYWVSLLNTKKDELYRDVTKNWSSAYDVRSLGTITASATPTYDIDTTNSDFLAASDRVYVVKTDTRRVYFDIIHPEERETTNQHVFIAGNNPQTLYFANEIKASDSIVGGTLYLPGYYLPADVTDATDDVPLPDPNWGVTAVAAELAFADITYEDRAPTLNDKANYLYNLMVKNNRRGTYKNPRITPTVVKRIRGY
jgi:hypothetical protein